MRKVLMVIGAVALLASCNKGVDKHVKLSTELDSVSYSLGLMVGSDLGNIPFEEGAGLDYNKFFSGFTAGYERDSTIDLTKEEAIKIWRAFETKLRAAQIEKGKEKIAATKAEGAKFLKENKEKAGVITTESGLQYEILKQGEGKVAKAGQTVSVHYVGTLLDGTEFDSSVKRNKPFEFEVGKGRVIKGWDEALQMMPVGSKWKLYIPAELAYGDRTMSTIPAGSVLIFDVELLEIK